MVKHQELILLLVAMCSFSLSQLIWSQKTLSLTSSPMNVSMVELHSNSVRICSYDSIFLSWKVQSEKKLKDIQLGMSLFGQKDSFVTPLANTIMKSYEAVTTSKDFKEPKPNNGLIKCQVNELFCVPEVHNIISLTEKSIIALDFLYETNTPALPTTSELNQAFDFSFTVTGEASGQWVNPKRLEISVESDFLREIMENFRKGEVISITTRTEPYNDEDKEISGTVSLRPTQHGRLRIFAVLLSDKNKNSHELVSNILEVEVDQCESNVLPAMINKVTPKDVVSPQAAFRMNGVFAVTGQDAMKFDNSAIPNMATGSWAMSFWIRLLEPTTGQHKAFFYKGNALNGQRTPSAWLLPHANRLALRVSTEENMDSGAETTIEIPTDQWTFMSFVFENHTHNSLIKDGNNSSDNNSAGNGTSNDDDKSGDNKENREFTVTGLPEEKAPSTPAGTTSTYTITAFVNNQLDIQMDFHNNVLGNEGPLQMFKDVSHPGAKSFVKDFIIWNAPLSHDQVKNIYDKGIDKSEIQAVEDVISLLRDAKSSLLPTNILPATTKMNSAQHLLSSQQKSILSTGLVDLEDVSTQDTANSMEDETESNWNEINVDLDLATRLLERAKEASQACDLFENRLDLYADAAERGSAEALYIWGMMIKYGSESSQPISQCGYDKPTVDNAERDYDPDRATYAFLVSADMGFVASYNELSLIITSGVGIDLLLHYEVKLSTVMMSVPVCSYYLSTATADMKSNSGNGGSSGGSGSSSNTNTNNKYHTVKYYKLSKVHKYLGEYLHESLLGCENMSDYQGVEWPKGTSVLCPFGPNKHQQHKQSQYTQNNTINTEALVPQDIKGDSSRKDPTNLALSLLYVAALHNNAEAQTILSYRYQYGITVAPCVETSTQYALPAVAVTSTEYHKVGGQPVLEADRIDDKTVREIPKGNSGNDDELIQHQIVRANEGHVPSMLAMGDLYYYGARGLPRDQVQALRYYEQAGALGDDSGLCGAANMYLKGEGTVINTTKAVQMYENASDAGSVRAYNGLGYIYFYGQGGVEKNATKAFHYFLMAADTHMDSESLFNAGYCLEMGIGTKPDIQQAVEYYTLASTKFGNFDAIRTLGVIYTEGKGGIVRSPRKAIDYLNAAKYIGPWAGYIRRGLDQFLNSNFHRAMACYFHAGEFGYEVAQSNTAYILRSKVKAPTGSSFIPKLSTSGGSGSGSSSVATSDDKNNAYHFNALKRKQAITNKFQNKRDHCSNNDEDTCTSTNTASTTTTTNEIVSVHSDRTTDTNTNRNINTNTVYSGRLSGRQYLLTAYHGNKDSVLELGSCYFKGACGFSRDYEKATFYYAKSSFLGNPLGSVYLGVMSHFGIGSHEVNIKRAERYYNEALNNVATPLETQLQVMVKGLKYALSLKSYTMLSSFNYGVEYVVKMLWGVV